MWQGDVHYLLQLLRLLHNTEHLTDTFLLVNIVLLQQLLVQPVWVCNARNWIRNLVQPYTNPLAGKYCVYTVYIQILHYKMPRMHIICVLIHTKTTM